MGSCFHLYINNFWTINSFVSCNLSFENYSYCHHFHLFLKMIWIQFFNIGHECLWHFEGTNIRIFLSYYYMIIIRSSCIMNKKPKKIFLYKKSSISDNIIWTNFRSCISKNNIKKSNTKTTFTFHVQYKVYELHIMSSQITIH
jgi:hypothetical protein